MPPRELLQQLRHENVIALKDIMMPVHSSFKDVYLVYELMDTDLHQIIKSPQGLSNDHCHYFLFRKMLIFDPTKRISVIEAHEHPYMSLMYDPSANPPTKVPIDLGIDENISAEMIREMMWQEMLHYHPEVDDAINM
ncbi:hypothetical protein GUJ93_ZPchr0010g8584 [Zizania palustris]|uniref:Uncharacterized protein n=1 Tax=Zizania palustris TaxID=103762 RepID=A0A8J5TDY9_ZIZPA|nr:hypothetical protein GUJ93_ZPchr0010g8584 [Zizania palustris]